MDQSWRDGRQETLDLGQVSLSCTTISGNFFSLPSITSRSRGLSSLTAWTWLEIGRVNIHFSAKVEQQRQRVLIHATFPPHSHLFYGFCSALVSHHNMLCVVFLFVFMCCFQCPCPYFLFCFQCLCWFLCACLSNDLPWIILHKGFTLIAKQKSKNEHFFWHLWQYSWNIYCTLMLLPAGGRLQFVHRELHRKQTKEKQNSEGSLQLGNKRGTIMGGGRVGRFNFSARFKQRSLSATFSNG